MRGSPPAAAGKVLIICGIATIVWNDSDKETKRQSFDNMWYYDDLVGLESLSP